LVCSSEDSFYAKIAVDCLEHDTLRVILKGHDLILEGSIKGHPPRPFRRRYSLPEVIGVEDISWKMKDSFLEIKANASSSTAASMNEIMARRHVSDVFAGGFKSIQPKR
jgi:HSP20 family molecular chaperone IbpA